MRQSTGASRADAERAAQSVGLAVVMSGLSTVVGFVSNAFTSIVRIREFGIYMGIGVAAALVISILFIPALLVLSRREKRVPARGATDRKSTRLNSSHVKNSYAVFCLKKKRKNRSAKHRH